MHHAMERSQCYLGRTVEVLVEEINIKVTHLYVQVCVWIVFCDISHALRILIPVPFLVPFLVLFLAIQFQENLAGYGEE